MENELLIVQNFYAGFGRCNILKDINFTVYQNKITAIMGPSGCGKTTMIRCINRMHEFSPGATYSGKILLHGEDIYSMNPILVRRKIGMVFQRPNPFPTMSIYDNVISGFILNGIKLQKQEKDKIVINSLKKVGLWEEVKDSLHRRGTFLSGGQQQRLCIARALAMNPDVILLDEPTSSLDPKSTLMIEKLLEELKQTTTIIIVTHNTAQAARISDYVAFLYLGELIEYGATKKIFTAPEHKKTEEYLTGKFS
ncbi:MAG TPA: phosphate ABC transporter ATP-binding protein PstB [bacterium]|nr:phosphate ABC transporter ATP-binding protein PstB [bacterium]HOL35118.1 phosphate ABC transporter ATP-binding protein PstB [bacterium]HPP07825.1 phosphate ABC transporter ATP-binding protein PstB [bacterium]